MLRNILVFLFIMLFLGFSSIAQKSTTVSRYLSPDKTDSQIKVVSQNNAKTTKSLLLTEDFSDGSLPTGWQSINNNGGPVVWEFDNPGGKTLNSSTGGNGFAICDSDFYGSFDAEDTDLITPVIDCSGATGVILSFEHWFDWGYGAVGEVFVSNDNGSTWTSIDAWGDNNGTDNAVVAEYNISTIAAGFSQVLVRWNWSSNDWCFSWAVDDVSITSIATSDAGVENVFPNFVRSNTTNDITLEIANKGFDDLNDFTIDVEINDGSTVLYSSTKSITGAGLTTDSSQFYIMDDQWTNTGEGAYNIIASVNLTGDENDLNDTVESTINSAELSYQRDKVYGYERINTDNFEQNQYLVEINANTGAYSVIGSTGIDEIRTGDFVGTYPNLEYVVTVGNLLYVLNSDGTPYYYGEVDLAISQFKGFTWDATQDLFYATDGKILYEINRLFEATEIGNIVGSDLMLGLAANSQGDLYGIGSDDNLYQINTTTGAGSIVGSLGVDVANRQDIAFDRQNDVLYGTLFNSGDLEGGLYTINLTTGGATLVGSKFQKQVTSCAIIGNQKYKALFNVSDGGSPVANAEIVIAGKTLNTDVDGKDSILLVSGEYPYNISASGFGDVFDTITILGDDLTENVTLSSAFSITFTIQDGVDPVQNATLFINGFEKGLTNASGQIVVELSPGDYDYTVVKEGFFDYESSITVVDTDFEEVVPFVAKLNVTFNFTDENSQPLQGVNLNINSTDYTSNSSGVVSFLIGPGDYPYTASIAGYNDSIGTLSVVDADVVRNIMMTGVRYTITFNVTDGVDPLENVNINIDDTDILTNAAGEATIDLPNGFYLYTATLENYDDVNGFIGVSGSDVQRDIEMTESLYPVVITVKNILDDPLTGAIVSINEIDSITNVSGVATFELPVGSYEVITAFDGYINDTVQITSTSAVDAFDVVLLEDIQDPQNLDIVVNGDEATFSWDQEIKAPNKAFVSYILYLDDLENPLLADYTDSSYVFTSLTTGSHQAGVQKVYTTDTSEIVTIDFDIVLEYTVTFTVTDGANPLEGATVSINSEDLTTDASGVATIDLPDGDYPYTISLAGYEDSVGSVTVAGSAVDVPIALNMLEYTVTFTVTDGTNPLEGATVSINSEDLTTDVSGIATIELANGTYPYTVTLDGYEPFSDEVIVAGSDVNVDVVAPPSTYTVSITVQNSALVAIEGASVELSDGTDTWTETTNASGIAVFSDIANGSYEAIASATGYENDTISITVEGADVDETITLLDIGISSVSDNFKLYPNPTSGILFVEANGTNEVTVLNAIGNVVKTKLLEGNGEIDLSGYTEGIYFIRLKSDDNIVTKRIILE